jgi:threonine/homoserine/homoserine lactone efflux protein
MEIGFLLRGLAIGFSIAAPVGPIGMLCIRRTLAEGRTSGLVCGLGAATADAVYGSMAGFGLVSLSDFLISQRFALRLIGGTFLLYLGAKTFVARPSAEPAPVTGSSLFAGFASTFFLTLANPVTILAFAAIFAGLGIVNTGADRLSAAMLVSGVFLGSALWWVILSTGVGVSRSRFRPAGLRWANRIAGAVILGFGAAALLGLGA